MAARKQGRGGPRKGAGRKPGPVETVRRNRVTFTLTNGELEALRALAEEQDLPLGTAAYRIVARTLRRRRSA